MVSSVCSFLCFVIIYQANESGSVERRNMNDQNMVGVSQQHSLINDDNGTISKGTILEAFFNNELNEASFNNTVVPFITQERRKRSSELNKTIHDTKLQREDEDLLELMVRIAETPEEWERIQHVLHQIRIEVNRTNVIENKSTDSTPKLPRSTQKKQLTIENNKIPNQNKHNNSEIKIKPNEKSLIVSKRKKVKIDSGWPNFSEIIRSRKKWKQYQFHKNERDDDKLKLQHIKNNNVEVINGLINGNMTQNLENIGDGIYHKETRSYRKSDDNIHKGENNSSILIFGKYSIKKISKDSNNITNENVVKFKTGKFSNISSRDSFSRNKNRPNFQYHRVTSNPRDEHKSNAILAISVVRKTYVMPSTPPTVMSTDTVKGKETQEILPWNHARHLHKLQEQLKSIAVVKSRLRHHWQHKEHRHHQYQSHRHNFHQGKPDINRLHH